MTLARTLALVAAAASVAAASRAAHAAPPEPIARYAPKGYPPHGPVAGIRPLDTTDYLYVAAIQSIGNGTAGAGATLLQADPALGTADFHSLAEIAVEGGGGQQIIEIGWDIDAAVNGDIQPHLFAFHWVDGQATCYNACGWVQVSPDKMPGMRLVPGESHRFEIRNVNGDWWLLYDNEGLGYFPGSLWGGRFTAGSFVQWFGEVAAASVSPCTQMGNGKLGSDAASAAFDGAYVFDRNGDAQTSASLMIGAITDNSLFDIGRTTGTSFGFGGPGAAAGCCTPSTCEAQAAECGSVADPVCTDNTLACGSCSDGVCAADHSCPGGVGPRDIGMPFDVPTPPASSGGGCCDASGGAGAPGALALAALVALALRIAPRRRSALRSAQR